MTGNTPRLAVKKASLPYYKPYVLVNLETHEVVGHYNSAADAEADKRRIEDGDKRLKSSKIQPTGDVFKEHQARMNHPFGETAEPAPSIQGRLGRRSVQL